MKLIVLTGGPGAGKTAALEFMRHKLGERLGIVQESASLLFSGGFPRHPTDPCRRAEQRAIYHVQRELEALHLEEDRTSHALCDRGTLDALAYWPGEPNEFFVGVGTTLEGEIERYDAVIHMRTPFGNHYNHSNPERIETARQAAAIDARITLAWAKHPRRFLVENNDDFSAKIAQVLDIVRHELESTLQ